MKQISKIAMKLSVEKTINTVFFMKLDNDVFETSFIIFPPRIIVIKINSARKYLTLPAGKSL
jgi:hypothetical protein